MVSSKPLDPIQLNLLSDMLTQVGCAIPHLVLVAPGSGVRSKDIESMGILDGLLESIFSIVNMSRYDRGN